MSFYDEGIYKKDKTEVDLTGFGEKKKKKAKTEDRPAPDVFVSEPKSVDIKEAKVCDLFWTRHKIIIKAQLDQEYSEKYETSFDFFDDLDSSMQLEELKPKTPKKIAPKEIKNEAEVKADSPTEKVVEEKPEPVIEEPAKPTAAEVQKAEAKRKMLRTASKLRQKRKSLNMNINNDDSDKPK